MCYGAKRSSILASSDGYDGQRPDPDRAICAAHKNYSRVGAPPRAPLGTDIASWVRGHPHRDRLAQY